MKFRALRADEIEVRVGTCNERGASLLLYKTARVDADILDETVGNEHWQCTNHECKGTLFCGVGIRCHRGGDVFEWVWKEDAGAPSNMEAEKGEASDAFKRACYKWGIGRELYTAPFIWVPSDKCAIVKDNRGKYVCRDRFSVAKIHTEQGRIRGVRVVNGAGAVVYSWKEQAHDAE